MSIDIKLKNFIKCDVFTPNKISEIMASFLNKKGTLLEPAVGDGQLLKYIDLDNYSKIDIYDIKEEYLEKCPNQDNIFKFFKDFLKENNNVKYDNIILNPPYIKIQDLSEEYREYIKNKWKLLNKGNLDIYYAFILKCLEILNDDGIMVCITPNSYLYNKSSLDLRKYLIKNRLISNIIDYKSEKVFDKVSTYCCITVFSKKTKDSFIYNNEKILYSNIINKEYNIFITNNTNTATLNDICILKNGIATLRDKIFIHDKKKYDEPCWRIITNGSKEKWCIFPYYENGNIIDETTFLTENPETYQYLENNKEELAKRDKGNKTYPKWYSYGRTQSLVISKNDRVLYVPVFTDPKNIPYYIDKPKLFISCLCIEIKDSNYSIDNVRDILVKNQSFIEKNSSKRGGGWITISGRILKQIPIE